MKTCIIIPWFNFWRTKNSEEFSFLKKSLEEQGHIAYIFDYEERPNSLEDLLKKLDNFLNNFHSSDITLIGFSLGSYIAVKYVQEYKQKNIKKIILCVPPLNGSQFFKVVFKLWPYFKKNTGKLIYEKYNDYVDPEKIPKNIDVGLIKGTKRINKRPLVCLLAQLFLLGKKNDGLIALRETEFSSFKNITLNIGHFESPKNKKVIENIINFIDNSEFIN
jgi:pimeloyl-ACP methyl ester carboxylesterase